MGDLVPPIIIMMVPRSGSSMVTSIFHAHGLWVGRCEPINQFGYFPFENVDIRLRLRHLVTPDLQSDARIKTFNSGCHLGFVRKCIAEIVPPDKPWVYKTGIDNWCLFDGLYPDMKFVFVKRNTDSVLASLQDKEDSPDLHSRPIIEAKYRTMDELSASRNIPCVHTDELIDGNYTSLEKAFSHCDLSFMSEIAKLIIRPESWNYAK